MPIENKAQLESAPDQTDLSRIAVKKRHFWNTHSPAKRNPKILIISKPKQYSSGG
jgi:hypothetical protein